MTQQTLSKKQEAALLALEFRAIHTATIQYVLSDARAHDDDFQFALADAIDEKVAQLKAQYSVDYNGEFLCQGESHQLTGSNLHSVNSAGRELALFLAEYESIKFV